MSIWKWILGGGLLLAVWLAGPLASAWMAGAAKPKDNSATCYSCQFARELQNAAFNDRFRNAHLEPAEAAEIRLDGCDRPVDDSDLWMVLAILQSYRMTQVNDTWFAQTKRVLRASFSNGTMALLARCIQDSALAPACRARVSRAIAEHEKGPEWTVIKQRLEAEGGPDHRGSRPAMRSAG